MSDAHTVLPAPKPLDLIGVRATENAITLAARTSSRCLKEQEVSGEPLPDASAVSLPAILRVFS
jgi:hypothetical protein